RSAALTFGLFERAGDKQVEAFGQRFWATPTWQRYVFTLASLDRTWARAGNQTLDREAVRTVQFQRLIWPRGLASERLLFDHVEFVSGAERPAVERKDDALVLRVDASRRVARLRRFWRAISVADTVEQNTDFAGPEGEAMRIIGEDGTFDYARIAWHVSRRGASWVRYRYGTPVYVEDAAGRAVEICATEYGNAIWGVPLTGRYQAAALAQMIDACVCAARRDEARMGWLFWFGTMRSFSTKNEAYFAPASAKDRHQITTLFLHAKGTVLAKPVYNAYRALASLDRDWLAVSGARLGDPVRALATLSEDGRRVSVLVYRHEWLERSVGAPAVPVTVVVEHLPFGGGRPRSASSALTRRTATSTPPGAPPAPRPTTPSPPSRSGPSMPTTRSKPQARRKRSPSPGAAPGRPSCRSIPTPWRSSS
ncbi:MAG: hypothetical protein ACODAJ_17245, partial [Planctomycetota bacterium]